MGLWVMLVFGALATAGPVIAVPDGQPPPRQLTLEDCIRLAMANQETMESAYFQVDQAGLEINREYSRRFPHLEARYRYDYSHRDEDNYSSIELTIGGEYLEIPQNLVRRKIAATGYEIAQYSAEYEISQLVSRVAEQYCLIFTTEISSREAELQLRLAEMGREIMEIREAAGFPVSEKLNGVREQLGFFRLAVRAANERLEEARRQFAQYLTIEEPFVLAEVEHLEGIDCEVEQLVALALDRRSDVRAAGKQVEQCRAVSDLAVLNRWMPRPAIDIGYGEPSQGTARDWFELEGFYVKTSVSYPMWDWGRRQTDITAARRELRRATVAAEAISDRVRSEVIEQYARLQNSRAETLARLDRKSAAEKQYLFFQHLDQESPQSDYERGRADQAMLEAEKDFLAAKCGEIRALAALAGAVQVPIPELIRLCSEPGGESPEGS